MKVLFTLILFLQTFFLCTIPITLKANPVPTPPCDINLGPDVQVCNNATFLLNPYPIQNGSYAWTGSIGLDCYTCPTPMVSGLTTGVYTYVATVTTPDCSSSDTIVVTVINGESPKYNIATNQDMCAGDSIELGGAGVSGTFYNWYSFPPGFVSNLANPKAKPTGPTTYYLSASNASCPLPVLDSLKVIPISLMLNLNQTDSITVCKGAPLSIQATVSPSGQPINWSPTDGLQISSNGASVLAMPDQSTHYTATVSLGGCIRQQDIFIALDSLPDVLDVQPADTTICPGESLTLGGGAGTYDPSEYPGINFKWTPLTGAVTSDTALSLVVMPDQSTLYRRITRNGVCADTAQVIVQVKPKGEMSITPALSEICLGDTVQFTLDYTSGVNAITWTPVAGLSCTSCDDPLATPDTTTTYTVSGKLLGCPVSATASISLKDLAPLQFPNDVDLCPGDTLFLNSVFDPLATYRWTSTHPGFDTVLIGNPFFVPTETAKYFVLADNGCILMDSILATVNTASLTVDGDTTICKNFSVPLVAMANLPGTFEWQNEQTGQQIGNMPAINVMPDSTTNYTVVYTYGDNCQITNQVTVVVDGVAPEIVFPTDNNVCPGESLTLNSGPVLPGSVYSWNASPTDPTLVDTAANPIVMPDQNTSYSVTATLDNCSISVQLNVTAFSATLMATLDTTICAGALIDLSAVGSDPNGIYEWSTGANNANITVSPDTTTLYTISYTYGDNCFLQETVEVAVVPGFELDIQCVPDTNQIDVGTMLTLTAVVTPPQNLDNFMFHWEETTVDTQVLPFSTESIDVTPSSNDTTTATVRYTLIASAPNGCERTIEKSIKLVFPVIRFPNAFTPDGDGNNDQFQMIVPSGLAFVDRMEIYNRWGQKVYESIDPTAGWDGTVDGEEAPSDVYAYRVWWRRGDGALQMQSKGAVTLLR